MSEIYFLTHKGVEITTREGLDRYIAYWRERLDWALENDKSMVRECRQNLNDGLNALADCCGEEAKTA